MNIEGLTDLRQPVKIFISYAHEDKILKDELLKHIRILKRQQLVSDWHDEEISPGNDWSKEITKHLESADVVLLLVSADFISSDFCFETEMTMALERHHRDEALVIPIFLRPVDWSGAPFADLQGLPPSCHPVTGDHWHSRDAGFEAVARGLRKAIDRFVSTKKNSRPSINGGITVNLISDYRDPDIITALEIYEDRIPPSERFEAPDIVRWLREDQEQRKACIRSPRDFFVVAKSNGIVCGFTLIHAYPQYRFAFIAYLVAEKGCSVPEPRGVAERILDFVSGLLTSDQDLKECEALLLEVDDPVLALAESERARRFGRIRLFCMLSERSGFALRALDFDYCQPHVKVPSNLELGNENPMLLMYATRKQRAWLDNQDVVRILQFLYNVLFPEGFSEVPDENFLYRGYLMRLFESQACKLPERIQALNLAQIRSRQKRFSLDAQ